MSDHKAEAQELFDAEFGPRQNQLGFETADAQHVINMLGALTQATLYLAEQQRIANIIAMVGSDGITASSRDLGFATWADGLVYLREGLGIS